MAARVEKVSVALGVEELAWARERAERDGDSLSAVLTAAARLARRVEDERARRDEAWSQFLSWATDGNGLDDESLEWARRVLDE